METQLNISLKWVVITFIIVLLLFGGGFWMGRKLNLTQKTLLEQKNLTEALQDSISVTINKYGEKVAEKKSLQASLKTLTDQNLNLDKNQRDLLRRVRDVQRDNDIISAALIETEAKLDSVLFKNSVVDINEVDSSITFTEINDSIEFKLTVLKAVPATPLHDPIILFDTLKIPNKQFIEFHWENNKNYKQKPTSFSITNSNPLIGVSNVDSYIIPEINNNVLKPTGWQKVGNFIDDNKSNLLWGVIGTSIGLIIGAGN